MEQGGAPRTRFPLKYKKQELRDKFLFKGKHSKAKKLTFQKGA